MLSDRQSKLLKMIVEEYIKEAKPVSSKSLYKALKCSSATVRYEMVYLEEQGLIEKNHISSGRVPSEKGYRYYVDYIMRPKGIKETDLSQLMPVLENHSIAKTDVIAKSMEIISHLTNYTTIVLGKASVDNLVSKVEVVPINNNTFIALIITDKGHVEHKQMVLDETIELSEIKQTVDLINKLIIGTPINEVNTILEFEVKPIIASYVKRHEVLYNAFYHAFNDFQTENVYRTGTKNILKQPEFNDVNRIREIIDKFEDNSIVSNIKEEEDGINIYIGSETKFDNDVTIVKTKYNINGEEGTIALIGPKRMEYDRVIALLNYIKNNIGGNDGRE